MPRLLVVVVRVFEMLAVDGLRLRVIPLVEPTEEECAAEQCQDAACHVGVLH